MISFDCNFESAILRTRVNVKVYLPNRDNFMNPISDYKERYTFKPFKTIFLLHGMMDSGMQWVENTNVVRLAQDAGMALVIPSCGNNFYINTIYGANYSDFITQELVGFVRALFPLSEKCEDNFLWGISMGGYGALRFGFTYPEMFSKVISMSPTSDIEFAARFAGAMGVLPDYILGNWKKLAGSDLDLQVIAQKAADSGAKLPKILVIIADQDHMVRDNEEFMSRLDELMIDNEFRTYPGEHTWRFWDEHVKECLDWLNEGDIFAE